MARQDDFPALEDADDEEPGEPAARVGVASPSPAEAQRFDVGAAAEGLRLDKFLALRMPQVSRARIQRWIADGAVQLNGAPARARASVHADDRVEVVERVAAGGPVPAAEAMPLPIVWEDEALIVVDKPAGLVVHPGAGNRSGTLLNGLLAYDARLAEVPRAGIVHRLDAGTSGLMVVARTVEAQLDLVRQLQARTMAREYWALAAGATGEWSEIDAPLARDPRNPLRFRVARSASARPARTFVRRLGQWSVGEPAAVVSWVACRLDTGRTHQIRVHLESVGHPLLGDPVYRQHLPAALARREWLGRQALHACRLELVHPVRREAMAWACAPPHDMRALMRALGASEAQLRAPRRMAIGAALMARASRAQAPAAAALPSARTVRR